MKQVLPAAFVAALLAACGGGGSDSPATAVSSSPSPAPAPSPSPAPSATTPAPAPPQIVVVQVPAPAPAPTPVVAPPPVPAPTAPAPASAQELAGGYPTVQQTCMQGTPRIWARPWSINYNGGVIRFTPQNELEQVLIWLTSNVTTQQHSNAATFSGPTTDGRQAWLTIHKDGSILGGGYHGTTPDSYLRCGAALDEVPVAGPRAYRMRCTGGYDNPALGPRVDEAWTESFTVDQGAFPWRTLSALPDTRFVTDPTGILVTNRDHVTTPASQSAAGTVQVYVGGFSSLEGSSYVFDRLGNLVRVTRTVRFPWQFAPTCVPG